MKKNNRKFPPLLLHIAIIIAVMAGVLMKGSPAYAQAATQLSLTVGLHGIGSGGDNVNPNSKGNTSPKNPTRNVTVLVHDTNDNPSGQSQGQITFNTQSGLFTGTVNLGSLPTGSYFMYVKTDGFLVKRIRGLVSVQQQATTTAPAAYLVTADVNSDNFLNLLDYNIIIGCFGSKVSTSTCVKPPVQGSTGADVDDTGAVDGVDYNLLIRELSNQGGDLLPTPTSPIGAAWNAQRAEYLARRALPDATNADVQKLSGATSAQNAVDMLFVAPAPTDVTSFQAGVQQIVQAKATYPSEQLYDSTLYTYSLTHNPDRTKLKLYYLWENIFSVDAPLDTKNISFDDVSVFHQMLYDNTYGNYMQLVGKMANTFAMAQYLDLTSSPANNPNENFAREIMQLMILGQYTPLDTAHATPLYSEQEVHALSYVLTGYTSNIVAHTVTFDPASHNTTPQTLFGQQFNDPANAVNYIFQQKKNEASLFLADKLLRYYVSDNASAADLNAVAQMVQSNNFEILPTVKQLLSSDIMYRDTYMQEERYKSPLELVSSYYTMLFGRNNYNVIPSAGLLSDLNFQPFAPGSIFGRDGFNTNKLFYSGSIENRWIADTSVLVNNISSQNLGVVLGNLVPNYQSMQTPDAFVSALASTLYSGRTLPQAAKAALSTYLTTDSNGSPLTFNITSAAYQNAKVPGLLNLMLVQPEFQQQSGNILATGLPPASTSTSATNILVMYRVKGGWDTQGFLANTSDPKYASNRNGFSIALTPSNSAPLGNGYSLGNSASALMPLIKSKEAFVVSAVGFPNSSRAHDIAGQQQETGEAANGVIALLANAVPTVRAVSFSASAPVMMKGYTGLQIGGSPLSLYPQTSTPNPDLTVRKSTLVKILGGRQLPQILSNDYAEALQLDSVGSTTSTGTSVNGAGNNNASQFAFLDKLIPQNVANVFYMTADGGFDNHSGEDKVLPGLISNVMTQVTNFYNLEKAKIKITIVMFSEFGRTNHVSGGSGTDHGEGQSFIILSNVAHYPTMTGAITPSADQSDWTTVQVDARDVWSTVFRDAYKLPVNTIFGRSTDLSTYPVTIP